MKSIGQTMLNRIQAKGRGWAFSAKDFLDLGNRGAVDVNLGRLLASGKIRRVVRGVYDYPREGELIAGPLAPDAHQVAQAIARKSGTQIHPSGAHAANQLGLSTQVPAKVVYLTDGPSKTVRLGNQTITFKHVHPKHLRDDAKTILAIQAIRFMGKDSIGDREVQKLRRIISADDRSRFLEKARYNTSWVAEVARRVVEGTGDG